MALNLHWNGINSVYVLALEAAQKRIVQTTERTSGKKMINEIRKSDKRHNHSIDQEIDLRVDGPTVEPTVIWFNKTAI